MRDDTDLTRRGVLRLAVALCATAPFARGQVAPRDDGFLDLHRAPDEVRVASDGDERAAEPAGNRWRAGAAEVTADASPDGVRVALRSAGPVRWVRLRWRGATAAWRLVLGDHWERAYGDLAWAAPEGGRAHPWYFLASPSGAPEGPAHGYGVRTRPGAFCHWTVEPDGVTLHCDVRAGGAPVWLGDRALDVCHVVARQGADGENAFAAARVFCALMCPGGPRRAGHVVYGFNDWYYAYGRNTPDGLLADAALLGELTDGVANRPYCVVDDGWQTQTPKAPGGQWASTRPTFGPMADLAAKMKRENVRPGLWVRPLLDELRTWPDAWHLARDGNVLDPSRPEVLDVVARDVRRVVGEWGYAFVKHDFTTFDALGRWGSKMDGQAAADGWAFGDATRTSAEILNALYDALRAAAGDAIVLGCNTVGHLSAGVFEISRIGDDTSGHEWERTVKMGVNALAFRAPHEGAFYAADADCVGLTDRIEWRRNGQWLDLAARSGTPLFVSADRKALGAEQRAALRDALRVASAPLPLGEPLDWMRTRTPTRWKLGADVVTYDWA